MTMLTREQLVQLAQEHADWRVSIYMPTHRAATETLNDQVALKNLLEQAGAELATLFNDRAANGENTVRLNRMDASVAPGHNKAEQVARAFVRPALEAAAGQDLWTQRQDGLAMFINAEGFTVHRLPYPTEPLVVVSKRHHITPLVPLLTDDVPFILLALSQNHVRTFKGNAQGMSEVEVSGMPHSLEQALWMEQPEKQRQMHSAGIGPTGTPLGVRHGHREDEHGRIRRFLHEVERRMRDFLRAETAPLILYGVDALVAAYREVNTYPRLHAQAIRGNPDGMTAAQIHRAVRHIIRAEQERSHRTAIAAYQSAVGSGRASSELRTILQAAHTGRVDTLLLDMTAHVWGSYDATTDSMLDRSERHPGDADLIDLAVAQTLAHNGTVLVLPASQMPTAGAPAAIFRY